MLNFIFIPILYFLFILFCAFVSLYISDKNFHKNKGLLPDHTIITVKNQEETIEATIRHIVNKMLYGKTLFTELIILDLDSTDNTPSILLRLSKDYPFIHITDKNSYKEYIDNLN